MPIYMDRHDVSEEVTAEIVAEIHQEDLRIQHKYCCKGLTYWYDHERKTAFCLVEAPNKEAIVEMHAKAHGEVPNTIIEVDSGIVESFLGRIEDPLKSQRKELNIVNNPAFRILVVIRPTENEQVNPLTKELFREMNEHIVRFEGRIVSHNENYILLSYTSVTKAINSCLFIKEVVSKSKNSNLKLYMGVSAGLPVTNEHGLFEETIKTAERLCAISQERIVITTEVKDLYESENLNIRINKNLIHALSLSDVHFLSQLHDFIEKEWRNPALNVDYFCRNLGLSTSQLYRKMMALMKKSTNTFIQDFRLEKAFQLLRKKNKNVSEIAFETGFNSAAYFTKCFRKKYHILPSSYIKNL